MFMMSACWFSACASTGGISCISGGVAGSGMSAASTPLMMGVLGWRLRGETDGVSVVRRLTRRSWP